MRRHALASALVSVLFACGGGSSGGSGDASPGADGAGSGDGGGVDAPVGTDGGGVDGGGGDVEPTLYYWGDFQTNGSAEVARVTLDDDQLTVLSLSGLAGSERLDFVAVSPSDETIAVGGDDSEGEFVVNLYSADGSGAPTPLAAGAHADVSATSAAFSPDGARLAFVADLEINGAAALYVVPTDGSEEPAAVSHAPEDGKRVDRFLWAGTDQLVFVGDTLTNNITNAYSVDASASTPIPVELVPEEDLTIDQELEDLLALDADGRAYFVGDQVTEEVFFLYRADLDGQNLERVPGPDGLEDGDGLDASIGSFGISDSGDTLAFSAGAPDASLHQVYVMDLSGSTPVLVSDVGAMEPPSDFTGPDPREPIELADQGGNLAAASDWQIASDSQGDYAAFVLPAAAPAGGVRVLDPAPGGGDAVRVAFTPDGSRLVVLGDLANNNDQELYLVSDLTTGDQDLSAVLFQDVPTDGDVAGFTISP